MRWIAAILSGIAVWLIVLVSLKLMLPEDGGKWIIFLATFAGYTTGQAIFSMMKKRSKLKGNRRPYQERYNNGALKVDGKIEGSDKVGTWLFYNENGKVVREEVWKRGKLKESREVS